MTRTASVLIPAHNEAAYITSCLRAVFGSAPLPGGWAGQVIVIANGCNDETAQRALATKPNDGWSLDVMDLDQGGKLNALTQGETRAIGDVLIYLDADVTVSPDLIPLLVRNLSDDKPCYGSGMPQVTAGASWVTRSYARFWSKLPFVTTGVPGFGIFAMTRSGRSRWGTWPDIISDDTFARLQFRPEERILIDAPYQWPMVEGFTQLVKVRRRQDRGVQEIKTRYPNLLINDDTPQLTLAGLIGLAMRAPLGFLTYAIVALTVRTPLFRSQSHWARGR